MKLKLEKKTEIWRPKQFENQPHQPCELAYEVLFLSGRHGHFKLFIENHLPLLTGFCFLGERRTDSDSSKTVSFCLLCGFSTEKD